MCLDFLSNLFKPKIITVYRRDYWSEEELHRTCCMWKAAGYRVFVWRSDLDYKEFTED